MAAHRTVLNYEHLGLKHQKNENMPTPFLCLMLAVGKLSWEWIAQ